MLITFVIVQTPAMVVQAATPIIKLEAQGMNGYFMRHMNSRGRMDTVINPIEDSQFRIVPGLASGSAVSIESVSFPGSFLRHRNGEIWLDANDGSSIFKGDATWYQRAGLADSSGVSFESYNIPGEYIRHRDYLLFRTPCPAALDKSDATFYIRQYNFSWIHGAVFIPTNVVNEVQQWDEYDPNVNDRELYNASVYGINVVRVYLHYLVWEKDKTKFLNNIEDFLTRANKYGIKTEFIFFDDCWNPNPKIGAPYPAPIFGVHNSQWVQCPGNYIKDNYASYKTRLQGYVQDVVNAHKSDGRVAFWETYNEPGNSMSGNYMTVTNQIMVDARGWIKGTGSQIPITSCGDFDNVNGYDTANATSDFFSFHNYNGDYSGPNYGGPVYRGQNVLCTECMNRGSQSVPGVDNAFYHNSATGYIVWEAGIGRDNCRYPWGNTNTEPTTPFHGIIYPDGHPWSTDDVKAIVNNDLSGLPLFNVQYFADNNFANLKKTSVTPQINFDLGNEFGTGSPDASAGIGIDNFSTRWTGIVKPTSTGTYTFYADCDNVARVWVNGIQIINKTGGGRYEANGTINLNANQNYNFMVEYVHGTGDSSLHIQWAGPNLGKQILLGHR